MAQYPPVHTSSTASKGFVVVRGCFVAYTSVGSVDLYERCLLGTVEVSLYFELSKYM